MYPPVHKKPAVSYSFDRLDMLWERYPRYHEMTTFTSLDVLLEEHPSCLEDFDDALREEYLANHYDRFLVQLSWADLPYRYAAKELIAAQTDADNSSAIGKNPYVESFLEQFRGLDTDQKACFLFPESFISQFFVVMEICKKAESLQTIRNLFPDEEKVHFLAVFDKQDMDTVLLMYHLLYSNTAQDFYGGYSLYDYSLPWYQNHLWENGAVLRSPFLPDRIAKYQGALPYYHNPVKTVYVRRNIGHILQCGYFPSELAFFLSLTTEVMPLFHWWYEDLSLYEELDGMKTNWRLERTRIRTRLTAEGVIKPKWKHELALFHAVRELYPETLYQYRPEWLGRQSLDLYIPSLRTAIEYQGIQHYLPVEFFGGEEALASRQELDQMKRQLCTENDVRLIEWPYSLAPTGENIHQCLLQHA